VNRFKKQTNNQQNIAKKHKNNKQVNKSLAKTQRK